MDSKVIRAFQVVAGLSVLATLLPAQATVQITSPASGTVVNPGGTITIAITTSGSAFTQAVIFGQNSLGICPAPTGPPFQCSMPVPADIDPGIYLLTAAAVDTQGNETDSSPITIDVEPAVSPVSIAALPATLTDLWIGDRTGLRVVGTYGDGSTAELTKSTQTTYVSQSPGIVTVSSDGLVTAVGAGSTSIIINGTLSVPVTVDPPISVTPAQAALTGAQTRAFVARVTNRTNPAVTWSLNPGYGSVDANGVYTAPVSVPAQETDVLTATSVADNTQTASATITLLSTASVTVLPAWAVLYPAQPQQFTATTSNAGTAGVTWSVSPSGAGTIDNNGLYTAPASISTTQAVTITATSVANPSISGSTTIYISPQPFAILLQLQTLAVGQGTSHGIDVTELAVDGFPHPVAFSVTGLPSGVTASFSQSTLTGTGDTTLSFAATTSAVSGSYTVNVVGQDTVYAALSQSQTLTLNIIGGFTLAVSAPTITTVPGGSVAVLVTESVTGGFNTPVLVSANAPTGIAATFPAVQQSVQQFTGPGSGALLFTVDPSLAPGSYPITISGQASTLGFTSSVNVTLVVNAITGPSVLTMSPNPGTQTTQVLTFTFTDPAGGASITTAGVLVNTSQSTASACYVQYAANAQTLSLSNDAGTGWAGSAVIGTYGELSNSQCLLDTGASQASISGSTLTLTVVLTPVNPVIGTQNVYATVSDTSSTSGWLPVGLWMISANSLPSPWRDQDIGAVGVPGYATYDPTSGTFTVNGSGLDINAPPDQFHYTYQPLVGDGSMVARLTGIQTAFQYTKVGLMVRATADPSAAYVFLNFQPNNGGCYVGYRASAGAASTYTACNTTIPLPTWMSVTRQGSSFSMQISPDGVTWTSAGPPITISMPANVLVGLAVVDTTSDNLTTATFDHVSVTPASSAAAPTFSPSGGTYASGQTVSISTATSGALIRYTTDGSTPSETTGILYTNPIVVSSTTTIKAIAYTAGLPDSTVAAATYTIAASQTIWVVDSGNNRVQNLDLSGTYLSQFGSYGSGNGQFLSPSAVAADASGNIWVVDTEGNRVEEFSPSGAYTSQFGTFGSGNGQFNGPSAIAIDASGNFWIADWGNSRVQEFNASGAYVSQFGSYGSGNGQFFSPDAIALDSQGNVWVVDGEGNRVEEFSPSGTYMSQFGTFGFGNGQLNGPSGLAIDARGNFWVTDLGNSRVQEFNAAGTYLSQFGSYGSGDGQFLSPNAIAIDAQGNIWVVDGEGNQLEEFSPSGTYMTQFGAFGFGNGQFNGPNALTIH